eukprot:gene9802-10840_t
MSSKIRRILFARNFAVACATSNNNSEAGSSKDTSANIHTRKSFSNQSFIREESSYSEEVQTSLYSSLREFSRSSRHVEARGNNASSVAISSNLIHPIQE